MTTTQFLKSLTSKSAAEWSRELQARRDAAAAAFAARAAAAKEELANA